MGAGGHECCDVAPLVDSPICLVDGVGDAQAGEPRGRFPSSNLGNRAHLLAYKIWALWDAHAYAAAPCIGRVFRVDVALSARTPGIGLRRAFGRWKRRSDLAEEE